MADEPAHTIVTARWVLPVAGPPLEHGWIEVRDGRVTRVASGRPPREADDLGDVALLPGLVNAHTHLELSELSGCFEPAERFTDWVRAVIEWRAKRSGDRTETRTAAMRTAVAELRATGTVLVGDVSNTLDAVPVMQEGALAGVVFHEILGFDAGPARAARLVRDAWTRVDDRVGRRLVGSVVGHAPYSTSADLLAEIGRHRRDAPLSVHLAESAEEVEFLRTGRGPFRTLLEELGVCPPGWQPPAADPVEYLAGLGYLDEGTLVVHGVHLADAALARLRETGCVLVTCPRSNVRVGAGLPRIAHAYAAGLPVAVGTDSLASNTSLNLFDELAELRRIAPEVAAASLLESATRTGAAALGYGRDFGTIEPGRRAAWVAVDLEGAVAARDVEEYLVSGVSRTSIHPVSLR